MQVRIARQTGQLDRVVAFYRDGLGLPEIDRFTDHDGYSGVMLDLPGTGSHLEFTATSHGTPPTPHVEDLLVLYLGSRQEVDRLVDRARATPVVNANPYWERVAVTIADPDGFWWPEPGQAETSPPRRRCRRRTSTSRSWCGTRFQPRRGRW